MTVTSQEALATSLEAPQIAVDQSGHCYIFFKNATGAPENHDYYFSLNDV